MLDEYWKSRKAEEERRAIEDKKEESPEVVHQRIMDLFAGAGYYGAIPALANVANLRNHRALTMLRRRR